MAPYVRPYKAVPWRYTRPSAAGSGNCRWRNQFDGDYIWSSRAEQIWTLTTAQKTVMRSDSLVEHAPAGYWRRLATDCSDYTGVI